MTAKLAQTLQQAQAGGHLQAKEIAAGLKAVGERNYRRFDEGESVETLIHETAAQIDPVLDVRPTAAWSRSAAMVAASYCRVRIST